MFATVNIKNGKGLVNEVVKLAESIGEASSFEVGGGMGLWAGAGGGTAWDTGVAQASRARGNGSGWRDHAGAHPRACAEGWRLGRVEDRPASLMDASSAGLGTPCYVRPMRWAGRRHNPWARGRGRRVAGLHPLDWRYSWWRWGHQGNGHPRKWRGVRWGRGKVGLCGGNEFSQFSGLIICRGM